MQVVYLKGRVGRRLSVMNDLTLLDDEPLESTWYYINELKELYPIPSHLAVELFVLRLM